MKNLIKRYIKNEDGLVTIEWVGIAAVVVVAGLVISGLVMNAADGVGGQVDTTLDSVAAKMVTISPTIPTFDGVGTP